MKSKKEAGRIICFGLVGVANTVVDYAVFWLLGTLLGIPETVAQIFSYSAGTANSFLCNRFFTFRDHTTQKPARELARFIVVNLASLAVSTLLVFCLIDRLPLVWAPARAGYWWILAKLFITGVTLVINYLGSRLFVWKEKKD